jgi:hypothetical protein
MAATEEMVADVNKKRAVIAQRRKKVKSSLSQHKACLMLKEGKVQGEAITKKQRGLFGAICSGSPVRKGR